MTEDIYDIAIVGAGPSGSTAAYYIDSKYKVLILDKFSFPRPKACGGCLFYSRDWPLEFENFSNIYERLNKFETKSIIFYSGEKKLFQVRTDHLYDKVSRMEMDNLLLQEALKKNNVVFQKFNVQKITKIGNILELNDGRHIIRARKIIGADGWDSVVARFIGNNRRTIDEFVNTLEYEIVCDRLSDQAHVFFVYGGELSTAWLLPTNQGYYIGLGIQGKSRKSLKDNLDDLIQTCLAKELIPNKFTISNRFGAPDPVSIRKIQCTDDVLLVGDALGTVSQLSGEGIDFGMRSGKIAAAALNENYSNSANIYKRKVKTVLKTLVIFPKPPRMIIVPIFKLFTAIMTSKLLPDIIRKRIQRWLFVKYSRSNKGFNQSLYNILEEDVSGYSY
ncbi:MAG: NAD(P)/FAD-dependent oxidoreductase [Patescibacteria group bacterium]